jgi:hypothetical protein
MPARHLPPPVPPAQVSGCSSPLHRTRAPSGRRPLAAPTSVTDRPPDPGATGLRALRRRGGSGPGPPRVEDDHPRISAVTPADPFRSSRRRRMVPARPARVRFRSCKRCHPGVRASRPNALPRASLPHWWWRARVHCPQFAGPTSKCRDWRRCPRRPGGTAPVTRLWDGSPRARFAARPLSRGQHRPRSCVVEARPREAHPPGLLHGMRAVTPQLCMPRDRRHHLEADPTAIVVVSGWVPMGSRVNRFDDHTPSAGSGLGRCRPWRAPRPHPTPWPETDERMPMGTGCHIRRGSTGNVAVAEPDEGSPWNAPR